MTMEKKLANKLIDLITKVDLENWISDCSFEANGKLFIIGICEDKMYISMSYANHINTDNEIYSAGIDLNDISEDDKNRLFKKMEEANEYMSNMIYNELAQPDTKSCLN